MTKTEIKSFLRTTYGVKFARTPRSIACYPGILSDVGDETIYFFISIKTAFAWYRNKRKWTTGMDLSYYNSLLEFRQKSDIPVWPLFYHSILKETAFGGKSPTGLFGNEILTLKKKESHRFYEYGDSGMVYWEEDSLPILADVDLNPIIIPTPEEWEVGI